MGEGDESLVPIVSRRHIHIHAPLCAKDMLCFFAVAHTSLQKVGPMLHLDYEFMATYVSCLHVAVSIVPYNTPAHIIQDNTETLWNDIIYCFVQGRFYAVAQNLRVLPYKRGHSGVFDVFGPLKARKEIFRLLTSYRESIPGVQLAVKIKFFRRVARGKTDAMGGDVAPLTIEHWAGRLWNTPKEKTEQQDEVISDHDPCQDDLVLG